MVWLGLVLGGGGVGAGVGGGGRGGGGGGDAVCHLGREALLLNSVCCWRGFTVRQSLLFAIVDMHATQQQNSTTSKQKSDVIHTQ